MTQWRKVSIFVNVQIVYFVAKGTVSFYLSKEYLEKEIREAKKNHNFGEIEMCMNDKIGYNIKVKSRVSELFVLKKTEFLRLSVNFKEFFERFLQKSLLYYLRFNEERKKLMKEMEEAGLVVGITDAVRKETEEISRLENIEENIDDEDRDSSIDTKSNKTEESINKDTMKVSIHSENIDLIKGKPTVEKQTDSLISKNKDEAANSKEIAKYQPSEANKFKVDFDNPPKTGRSSVISKYSADEIQPAESCDSDFKKNIANPGVLSMIPSSKFKRNKYKKYEIRRSKLHQSFTERVESLISYFEKANFDFSKYKESPLDILRQLEMNQNNSEREELSSKLEKLLHNIVENNSIDLLQ